MRKEKSKSQERRNWKERKGGKRGKKERRKAQREIKGGFRS